MLSRLRLLAPVLLVAAVQLGLSRADGPKAPDRVDFTRDVRPILQQRCYSCHGPEKQRSSFRLDRKADALRGGESGRAIVPGKSADSPLIHRATGRDGSFMPPKGERLTAEQVAVLRAWIDQGANWPDDNGFDPRKHWAFQTPTRPPLPEVRNADWCRTPLDR